MKLIHRYLGAATLIAAACQHADAQPAAQPSSVTLYGTADAGFYARELAGENRVNRIDSGMMTTSRWGLRGVEDLGGGLSAFFDLSSHVRLDTGEPGRHPGDTAANRFWTRHSFVGLRGAFGQIRAGRIATGSWVNALTFNSFAESAAFGPFLLHTFVGSQPMLSYRSVSDGSWSNSIAYNTPQWGGFSGAVQAAAREGTGDGRRFDGTINYRSGMLATALSYTKLADAAFTVVRGATDPAGVPYVIQGQSAVLGSVSYDFKFVQLFGQFNSAKMQPRGLSEISLDTVGLSASVPAGGGRILASLAQTERQQAGVSDRTRTTVTAGYDYILSKRTDLYGVMLHDRASNLSSGTGYAIGVRHHF